MMLKVHGEKMLMSCSSEKERLPIKNEIWLVDGILKHRLRYEKLKEIVDKYNKLSLALTHYYLPELCVVVES